MGRDAAALGGHFPLTAVTAVGIPVILVAVAFLVFVKRPGASGSGFTDWAFRAEFAHQPRDETLGHLSRYPPFADDNAGFGHDVFRGVYRGRHVLAGFLVRFRNRGIRRRGIPRAYQLAAVSLSAPVPMVDIAPRALGPLARMSPWLTYLRSGGPDFDAEFQVATDDDPFAGSLLGERATRWLLADPRSRRYRLRCEGDWALAFRVDDGHGDCREGLDFLCDFVESIGPETWTAH